MSSQTEVCATASHSLRLSEDELCHHLQDSWVARAVYRAKPILICRNKITVCIERKISRREVSQALHVQRGIDSSELRVVEGIEGVNSKLEMTLLAKRERLLKREVEIIDAWSN